MFGSRSFSSRGSPDSSSTRSAEVHEETASYDEDKDYVEEEEEEYGLFPKVVPRVHGGTLKGVTEHSTGYDFSESLSSGYSGSQRVASDGDEISVSLDEPEYDESIRTSVVNRMIREEDTEGLVNTSDRFRFTKLYERYAGTSNEEKGLSEYEMYTKNVWKEAKLREKHAKVLQQKQAERENRRLKANVNVIDEAGITNYEGGYEDLPVTNTTNWFQKVRLQAKQNKLKKKRERNLSTDSALSVQISPSSINTIAIDDVMGMDRIPIDLQPRAVVRKNPKEGLDEFEMHNDRSSSNIYSGMIHEEPDIFVSGRQNVDYSLKPLEGFPYNNAEDTEKGWKWYFRFNKKRYRHEIQRKLKIRHLHQIALGGTLGVGLLLSSGKAFSIAGPLGCLLGFMFAGSIVIATMLSFCEMITLIPLAGGVSGISSRFVDDAFGFALGVGYYFSYMIGMPTEITAATIMLSFYTELKIPGASTAGWISFFLVVVIGLNLCDIRVYGEVEYFSTIIKLLILTVLILYMIILNRGGSPPYHEVIGFRYWDSGKSNATDLLFYGLFRPTFDVTDVGLGSLDGIGGAKGRLCSFLVASIVAAYAYVGTEIVLIAGGESRNPRKAIPSATKSIYWRIIIFYVVAIFVVGLNIYSGDPRLLRYFTNDSSANSVDSDLVENIIALNGGQNCHSQLLKWAGFANGNQSPWIIALQSAGLCNFASVMNAFLVYFALTAGSSQLYASSRTLYYLSIQGKAPKMFSICSARGVPYVSVLFTGFMGALAYLSVKNNTALVFERLLSVCATTGLLVWSGMCLSFIRFYYGLKLRPDIIGRDDENYPYRSPFQPYLAYFGMISAFLLVLVDGFIVFFRGSWSTAYFFSSYGSLILFILCYVVYKFGRRTKIHRLDQLDLDSGRREIDRIIWEEDRNYVPNFKEYIERFLSHVF
ncbi:unnamed protein product [Kuraishia capsulata CBS 1993]|uniref:Amino acid permease/ SLC12A domain-containing protein n=1 Tax=Kuraishia capsulata CBS 1993 TaxID=1382522 RepID=W6MGA7_9ASCO|nr:uncharacterized protein KUCA_T00001046001 [Kuraishia capsulata CBS 1993]CDK25079.1 unnamed protein product [Kuraishia capsulata CBS 1993]